MNLFQRLFRQIRFSAAIAMPGGLLVLSAAANPQGATVSQGTATVTSTGPVETIQTSDRAVINWQSFNIGAGETTSFLQPSSSSVVWNQINSATPSQILGNLNANGYVILQNQSGFFVGGQAAITAHGLIMTTSPTPPPDLSSGGAWSFNTPPPTAKIINYGQISLDKGGSVFLIANDIENKGSINAPSGNIGLYAGKQVLVSASPDGRGLSASVTLPQGSVDNTGKLVADAGTIAANAQVVNQGGLVQANSVREVNGKIELLASDSLTLEAGSQISARGDTQGSSAGGSITLKSGNTYQDSASSSINVSGGSQGGNGGQIEISAPHLSSVLSSLDGHAAAGFVGGSLSFDPTVITLDATQESTYNDQITTGGFSQFSVLADTINLVNGWTTPSTLSQLNLNANQDITLGANWTTANTLSQLSLTAGGNIFLNGNSTLTLASPTGLPAGTFGNLTMSAGNNITLGTAGVNAGNISAGNGWNVNLTAGTGLAPGSLPASGNDSIVLNGTSFIQSQNGGVTLAAPNQITVNTGAIRTVGGGSINVTTTYGDVNTGTGTVGYQYRAVPSTVYPYYYSVSSGVSGISTAAGGDVNITAGGNVTSYLPNVSASANIAKADPGTGAFGPQPGNVTIKAGGNIYGHYVVANGTGSLSAQDIGSLGQNVALSLVAGSWKLNAAGNIYLQEVRNPNGVFDQPQSINSPAYHYFDYDPNASVDLTAGNGVYLLGQSLPRPNGAVPVIFPPSLDITAGSGGVNLETSIILFPSPNQNLQITTTGQGDLVGLTPNATLSMSDSGQTRFVGSETFGTSDHASTPPELNNPNLVMLNINGNMKDLSLVTDKPTQIKVGGDMTDCSFSGENLHAGDKTSITVTGNIFNQGSFNSVFLTDPVPLLSQADSSSHTINNWEGILAAAVNPDKIAAVTVPGGVSPSDYYANYVAPNLQYGGSLGSFFYNATTGRLTFVGSMDGGLAAALQQPLTVVRYDGNGNPVVINGKIQTDQVNWIPATAIQSLYVASQGAPLLSSGGNGYQIGGPGEFDITAKTISLGNTQGILSYGAGGNYGNLARYVQSGGASIVVKTQGDLDLPSSTIAALSSGNVDVESLAGSMDLGSQDLLDVENLVVHYHGIALGIYSTGGGDVTVKALHNINVDSSRIAAFNGGKVTVESYQGDVNAGSGGTASIPVYVYYVDPVTGQPNFYLEQVFASGIVTETLVNSASVPGAANAPGNITVTTPQGNINASEGGILQEALNGNVSAGPTVTLSAGSDGFVKDVNLGNSGVIGGTVNVTATGNVTGLVISRQDSSINAAQNFSGTVLSGGTANLTAGGTASGVVIGIGGVNASSSQSVNLVALGQNVSVNGGAATSTLGTTSGPSATATSAGADSDNQAQKQTAGLENSDNDDTKKKNGLASSLGRLVKRVTIIL